MKHPKVIDMQPHPVVCGCIVHPFLWFGIQNKLCVVHPNTLQVQVRSPLPVTLGSLVLFVSLSPLHSLTSTLSHLYTLSPLHSLTSTLSHLYTLSPLHSLISTLSHLYTLSPLHSLISTLSHLSTLSYLHSLTSTLSHLYTLSSPLPHFLKVCYQPWYQPGVDH